MSLQYSNNFTIDECSILFIQGNLTWSWRNYHLFIGNICQLDKHFLTCFFIDDDGFNPKGSMVEDSGSMGLDKVARIYGWTL